MSTPIIVQALVLCGANGCAHAINVPVGERKRSERRPFVEGYAQARGWTVKKRTIHELASASAFSAFSSTPEPNDWRCPDCSKGGAV